MSLSRKSFPRKGFQTTEQKEKGNNSCIFHHQPSKKKIRPSMALLRTNCGKKGNCTKSSMNPISSLSLCTTTLYSDKSKNDNPKADSNKTHEKNQVHHTLSSRKREKGSSNMTILSSNKLVNGMPILSKPNQPSL